MWFKKAADRGHTGAMVNLGKAYTNGHGVAQDYARALALFHAVVAVDGNNKTALFNLGQVHFESKGVEDNYVTHFRSGSGLLTWATWSRNASSGAPTRTDVATSK